MNRILAFLFFMLFLAGIAFLLLRDMRPADSGGAAEPRTAGLVGYDWYAIDGSGAYVRFEADGKLSGSGGCNRYFGNYVATDETIETGPLGATKMACAEALMASENRFLGALQSATHYRIDGRMLRLSADGTDLLTLRLVVLDAEQTKPES